jgi:hypothetical protein
MNSWRVPRNTVVAQSPTGPLLFGRHHAPRDSLQSPARRLSTRGLATLRYDESRGLLTAGRDGNGYRDYGEDDLWVLRQIQVLQDRGSSWKTGAGPLHIADLQHVRDLLQRELGQAEAGSLQQELAEVR